MPITISPPAPTSDDSIELVFSGSGCVLSTSQAQVGANFEFTIILNGTCFATPPSFSFTWNVGRLPPGDYTTTLSLGGSIMESQALAVSQGVLPFPAPIPSVGFGGLVLLAVAMVLIANKSQEGRAKAINRVRHDIEVN